MYKESGTSTLLCLCTCTCYKHVDIPKSAVYRKLNVAIANDSVCTSALYTFPIAINYMIRSPKFRAILRLRTCMYVVLGHSNHHSFSTLNFVQIDKWLHLCNQVLGNQLTFTSC